MKISLVSPKYGQFVCYYDSRDNVAIKKHKWRPRITKNGTVYAAAAIYNKNSQNNDTLFMHNLIIGVKGIDHIDRNGLNNRRSNLRVATQKQNVKNQSLKSSNRSGFKGVSFDKEKGKYEAYITNDYKRISGGYFNNPVEAAKKYNKLAIKHHKEFCCLNLITKEDEMKYEHIVGRELKPKTGNTTGYRGVFRYSKPFNDKIYQAKITVDGKQIHLGSFHYKIDAAKAYNIGALKYKGDSALLNKV